jgi:hypothetical protein
MDTNMEDVGKLPEPSKLPSSLQEPASIPTLDGWIESLMTCKQLAENDVQRLCDRVSLTPAGVVRVAVIPRIFVLVLLTLTVVLKGEGSITRRVKRAAGG